MTSIPEISARGSLILWAQFQIPVGPRSGREGEKCRLLDHMRQIPFIHQLCSHPSQRWISIYIQNSFSYFFHMVFRLCIGQLFVYHLRMRSSRITWFRGQSLQLISKLFCSQLSNLLVQNTWHLHMRILKFRKLSRAEQFLFWKKTNDKNKKKTQKKKTKLANFIVIRKAKEMMYSNITSLRQIHETNWTHSFSLKTE